ncbi:hypothetical protein JKG68_32295 [Microvirga aerilata]|jgi:hypothetical protein|uniref:Uncharacterized protein n=1 Tax=Microvirga aerilata TaxID=670292 RepID=A0A936ZJZ6_9HYPH|nr:hypothetical protein [Microvirga aerilata]MBL0408544.1 hypothetical protein [Microvirga aerilata]
MKLDDPFPLEAVSSRVRAAVLYEFQGRCPSIREMTRIPDKQWLATPGIGRTALGEIRSVADDRPSSPAASAQVTDAELLERLEFLQKELQGIYTMLKGRMVEATRIDA